jgi:integrase
MKMEREHLMPLSSQTVGLLNDPPHCDGNSGDRFVFSGGKPGQSLSQNTMIYACYRISYHGRQTVHGFRGLASTWANEAEDYRSDWIEMALAHAEQDVVRGAYNSALYLTPRRRMLQNWGDFVAGMVEGEGDLARSAVPQLESTT